MAAIQSPVGAPTGSLPDTSRQRMDVPWIISGSSDKTIKIWHRETSECIQTLEGHTDSVKSIAWSPTVLSLASASDDNTVKIWDLATRQCISTLEGHSGAVNAVDWSPDGTSLASASKDKTIKIWNSDTRQCVLTLEGHSDSINSVSWSSDGTEIISAADDSTLKIWSSVTGECISTLIDDGGQVYSATRSPDGLHLASASNSSTVKVWDEAAEKCTLTLEGDDDAFYSVDWSPDAVRLAAAARNNTIKIWNASSGQCISTLESHSGSVMGISWSPDAAWLVSASSDMTIRTWDSTTGESLTKLTDHSGQVNTVIAVTRIGKLDILQYASLLECDGEKDNVSQQTGDVTLIASGSQEHEIKLWDPETSLCTATLVGHKNEVLALSWSPDGNYIASASDDCTVKIWDARTNLCKLTLESSSCVWEACWSPDGTKVAAALRNGNVMIWSIDPNTATATLTSTLRKATNFTLAVAWSPDGTRIIAGSDDSFVRIWDPATSNCMTEIPVEHCRIFSVSWSPDSKLCAFGTNNTNSATIWDPTSNQSKMVLKGHTDVVRRVLWSPDGNKFVTASDDRTIKLWDLSSGNCLATLEGHSNYVMSVAWSPDGSKLVSGSLDKTVKIWDAVHTNCIATLEGHRAGVSSIAWSPIIRPPQLPDSDADDGLARWMQDFMDIQNRLRALESDIDGTADRGVKAAVDLIAKGLAAFNELIRFWPDYNGDGNTNEHRLDIIYTAANFINDGMSMLTSTDTGDGTVAQQLSDIEKELKKKKAQFTNETVSERAVLATLGLDVLKAIVDMSTCQESYNEAQSELLVKIEQTSLAAATHHHSSRKENAAQNYALPNTAGSLDDVQQADELAYLVLERAQDKVRNLQLREQALRRTQKNRPIVQRAITRAEKLVSLLRMMSFGLTKERGRLLAVANLITPAIKKLATVGEPPYSRPHRRIEDDLCTTILMIHRESLIEAAFADSARQAVGRVEEWFDEDIPKKTQAEIDAIIKNPLY